MKITPVNRHLLLSIRRVISPNDFIVKIRLFALFIGKSHGVEKDLRRLRRRLPVRRMPFEDEKAPRHGEYVCADQFGKPLRPCAASKWLIAHRDKMGVPGWGMHHFRHQFATNLAYNNINPRTMAALLGHSSPIMSLKVYTHLQGSQTADAIALVDAKKLAAISPDEGEEAEVSDLAS